jgi:GWxTD domain-containing protein
MTLLESWVQTPLAQALGWTLFHSLWEGVLAAAALAAALCVIHSSRVRYIAGCVALLAVLAGFGLTFARVAAQLQSRHATMERAQATRVPQDFDEPSDVAKNTAQLTLGGILPWLAPFWIAGVLLFYLRNLAGWTAAHRLRRIGVCGAPDVWQEELNRLGTRLHLSRPVALLESCLAEAPVVIGHVRPVILMPIGLLAGMPAGQVEMILLHELAHIRRYDYLANLLQTSVEGLLFYHPAVWWISGVIRAERENCCDDLAVSANGDAHEYAIALAALERNRSAAGETALAATGGNLVKRIRRLLGQPEGRRPALTPVFSAGIVTIAAAVAMAAWQSKPAEPSPAGAHVKLLAQVQEPASLNAAASPYDRWLNEDVVYIITDQERAAFKSLQSDPEREHFIEQFWQRRSPTPDSPENKFKEEHYRRIAYANKRFASRATIGWKTDRGRIYITYGPPDEIDSHPSGGPYTRPPKEGGGQAITYPFEEWVYRYIEGVGNDVTMAFVDPTMTGDYRMTMDPSEKETILRRPFRFSSPGPGWQATVEITHDRRMLVSVPIDFDAPQYSITGTTRSADGSGSRVEFTAGVSLCKNSPGTLGCLAQPMFHVNGTRQIEPGDYEFQAIVKAPAGAREKTYTVHFQVN